MATFSPEKQYEVKHDIDSPILQRVRELAQPGTFKAFSLCYRHPRYKSKFSPVHFYVQFRHNGTMQAVDCSSAEELDRELTELYLAPLDVA